MLNTQAMRSPLRAATSSSGNGELITCSSVNPGAAYAAAQNVSTRQNTAPAMIDARISGKHELRFIRHPQVEFRGCMIRPQVCKEKAPWGLDGTAGSRQLSFRASWPMDTDRNAARRFAGCCPTMNKTILSSERRLMRMRWWMAFCVASIFALSGNAARAQGEGHGHGHGHDKDHHDKDGDRGWYSQHDRDDMRSWYHDHEDRDDLPPGLAKRDR